MQQIQGIVNVTGRVLLCSVFLMAAIIQDIPHFADVARAMASHAIPWPRAMLGGAIVLLIAGSLSVITGYRARLGATLLLVFVASATWFFHNFWDISDPTLRQEQFMHFMKNLSIMGAMLIVVANGAGPMSIVSFQARK